MELDCYRPKLGRMERDANGEWVKLDDAAHILATQGLSYATLLLRLTQELSRARQEIDSVLQSTSRVLN